MEELTFEKARDYFYENKEELKDDFDYWEIDNLISNIETFISDIEDIMKEKEDNSMTREKLEKMSYDELINYCIDNLNCFTNHDDLKDYAIEQIEMENLNVAIHILECINEENTYYFIYDYSMGTLETPRAIYSEEEMIDLILEQEGE